MKIKNYLKLKKYPILLFLCIFALSAPLVLAGEIEYRPNIAIPGSSIFGGGTITITSNTFAEYIKAIYRYAGIMAGAFAMFMLVYGAWQWLMAAGNASKITMAKETVSTTLIGLAFLFGGYLLLSQISTRLVNLQPLVVKTSTIYEPCATYKEKVGCERNNCLWKTIAAQNGDESISGFCYSCNDKAADFPCGQTFQFNYTIPGTQIISEVQCPRGYKCAEELTSCQGMTLVREVSTYVDCNQTLNSCSCRGVNEPSIQGSTRMR